MRTEAILLIRCNCFEMWWPGTELNRRRQPFQGCALPPELPGHFWFPRLPPQRTFLKRRTSISTVHWASSLGGLPEQTADALRPKTVRNLRIIATPRRSLKIELDFRPDVSHSPAKVFHIFSRASETLGTPFMIVTAQ